MRPENYRETENTYELLPRQKPIGHELSRSDRKRLRLLRHGRNDTVDAIWSPEQSWIATDKKWSRPTISKPYIMLLTWVIGFIDLGWASELQPILWAINTGALFSFSDRNTETEPNKK